ncbi:MAG: hypothetical protein AB1830_07780 [Pseudomonadota bacterium]
MSLVSELIERHQLIRRLAFFWMMGLTTYVTTSLLQWAFTTDRDLLQVAAVIGAFMTPLSALQGYVFSFYNRARERE